MTTAPILLFAYKKLEPLKRTVQALQKNKLASSSELIIFSDGPQREEDHLHIEEVRDYIKKIDGFGQITTSEEGKNKGLATSIIDGVSEVLKTNPSVIVLEDDLVTSENFLNFMNQALQEYQPNQRVHSISGYTVPMDTPKGYPYDNYFTRRASSWGWATWKERWETVDWSVTDYEQFVKDSAQRKKFNEMGSDMSGMLVQQMSGKISSWAIRWCYDQFKKNQLTVFPTVSKVSNIGFGENATHTKGSDTRFATLLDTTGKEHFDFNPKTEMDSHFIGQFTAKYSLTTRAYYRLKNILRL